MRRLITLAFLLVLLLSPSYGQAAELSFATSKSLFDAEILPGTTYEDHLTVFNGSKEIALPIHIQMSLWGVREGSDDDVEFLASQEAVNPLKWFSLVLPAASKDGAPIIKSLASGYDFILEKDGVRELTFRVKPPNDVAPGTYLVSMRLQPTLPDHYFETTGPRILPEVAILFFLKVPNFTLDGASAEYRAEIVNFGKKQVANGQIAVAQAGFTDSLSHVLAATIKNTGLYYFKAAGEVVIRNWFGTEVKKIGLPGRYLLPGKTRTIEIPVEQVPVEGLFARLSKYVSENSYLGRYTATLILQYPPVSGSVEPGFAADSFTQTDISFWIIPWRLMFWVALIVALGFLFIHRFGRRLLVAIRILVRRER